MPYTDADLTAILAAIAKGELRVAFADRSVEYRSIDELLKAKADILNDLTQASATPHAKQFLGVARKGF